MKLLSLFFTLLIGCSCFANGNDTTVYTANHPYIQYTGRVDFTNPLLPKFWAPGVYVKIRFSGTYCVLQLNDEELYGKAHNYIEVAVDNNTPYRIQTKRKNNTILLANGLRKGKHTITICKNTEANIGYLQIVSFKCKKLLMPPARPARSIEFIGNSITCGMGNDISEIPCGKGEWYDQHNAWLAYGPLTARSLKSQWQLSSVSGIGLIKSCCGNNIVMPQVFDKVYMNGDTIAWNFNNYRPDVVTVCLGQNDGIQDSTAFCSAYVKFVQRLRGYYPEATIILLTSPMGNAALNAVLQRYIVATKQYLHSTGDNKIGTYIFSRQYSNGCGGHPDKQDHEEIANELISYLKKTIHW